MLADFLVETPLENDKLQADGSTQSPEEGPPDCWKVYVDGSSTKGQSEAGVVIISPQGTTLQYTLRFDFNTPTMRLNMRPL